jgi:hypothetical protein
MRKSERMGRLVRDLDGEVVAVESGAWRIALYGVRLVEGYQCVQLVLVGEPMFSLTLRLPCDTNDQEVLLLLSAWLEHPEDYGHLIVSEDQIAFSRIEFAPPILLPRAAWSSRLQ